MAKLARNHIAQCGVLIEQHSPVGGIGEGALVSFGTLGGHQVVQRDAGRVGGFGPLLKDGVTLVGVDLGRLGFSLRRGAFFSQLGNRVLEPASARPRSTVGRERQACPQTR